MRGVMVSGLQRHATTIMSTQLTPVCTSEMRESSRRASTGPRVHMETKVTNLQARIRATTKAVIFDKDGTLISFQAMWVPWINHLTIRLREEMRKAYKSWSSSIVPPDALDTTIDSLTLAVHIRLGFDPVRKQVGHGLLSHGTAAQIRDSISEVMTEQGIDSRIQNDVMPRMWRECAGLTLTAEPIGDIISLLKDLCRKGYKLALNTSDSRAPTIETLKSLDIMDYFDVIVCGDDANLKPKPSPMSANKICSALSVKASEVMMVGDTSADLLLAKNANLAFSVGVLSGASSKQELAKYDPDIVIESVQDMKSLM